MTGSVYKVTYSSPDRDATYVRYYRTMQQANDFVSSLPHYWQLLGYSIKNSENTCISIEEV